MNDVEDFDVEALLPPEDVVHDVSSDEGVDLLYDLGLIVYVLTPSSQYFGRTSVSVFVREQMNLTTHQSK